MVFVELTPFVAFRDAHWTDEEFTALQQFLVALPDAGSVIRGAGGLRKLRWRVRGRGKRGGTRIIYYWDPPEDRIYLIYGYSKSDREDLTPSQLRVLRQIMRDM